MHLHIATMDAVLVEFAPDGRVRWKGEEGWSTPTRQEIRAIIHAAGVQVDQLADLIEVLEKAIARASVDD
jgi:hypothetical protein